MTGGEKMGLPEAAIQWGAVAGVIGSLLALIGALRSGKLASKTTLTAAQVAAGTAERAQLSTDTQAFLQALERQVAWLTRRLDDREGQLEALDDRLRDTQADLDQVKLIGKVMAGENVRLKDRVLLLTAENAQLRTRVAELERRAGKPVALPAADGKEGNP